MSTPKVRPNFKAAKDLSNLLAYEAASAKPNLKRPRGSSAVLLVESENELLPEPKVTRPGRVLATPTPAKSATKAKKAKVAAEGEGGEGGEDAARPRNLWSARELVFYLRQYYRQEPWNGGSHTDIALRLASAQTEGAAQWQIELDLINEHAEESRIKKLTFFPRSSAELDKKIKNEALVSLSLHARLH